MMVASVASRAVVSVESTCVVTLHHNESHDIWLLPFPHFSPSKMHMDGITMVYYSMVDMSIHSRFNE